MGMGPDRGRGRSWWLAAALTVAACAGGEQAPQQGATATGGVAAARVTPTGAAGSTATATPPPRDLTEVDAPTSSEEGASCGEVPDRADEAAGETVLGDAGAPPCAPLRYDLEPGTVELGVLGLKQVVEQEVDGVAQPEITLPLQFDMRAEVLERDGDLATVVTEFTDVFVDPAGLEGGGVSAEELEEVLRDTLVGTRIETTITSSGAVVDGTVELSSMADPAVQELRAQLESQLSSLALPLPAEAVGQGAEWSGELPVEISGLSLTNLTTYRLTSRDGSSVEVETEVVQDVPLGAIDVPGLPSGAVAELLEFSGSATGTAGYQLDRVLPRFVGTDGTVEQLVSVSQGGQVNTVRSVVRTELAFGARPPEGGDAPSAGQGSEDGETASETAIPAGAAVFEAEDLAFTAAPTSVPAGGATIALRNASNLPHTVVFEGVKGDQPIVEVPGEGVDVASVALEPGTYTYYCSVPGHRQAGMEGTIDAV